MELQEAYTTPWAQFHAYVLSNLIGIRWSSQTSTITGSANDDLYEIVREYLAYVAGDDEWKKRLVLDGMRNKSASLIKSRTRRAFPSIFPRRKRARPFDVPEELKDEEVKFDPRRVELWRLRVKIIKEEIAMNENILAQETTDETEVVRDVTSSDTGSRVTINFVIPQGTNPATLTLENYREVTGKRFRMTKDQKVRGLSREDAFAESRTLAANQLGGE